MASTKNITMKEYNGVDYDTLYPKTVAEQVIGIYSKDEILSDETKQLYNFGTDATPNDIFLKLLFGAQEFGYIITLQSSTGMPLKGLTISGINPLPSGNLVSNDNGVVIGKSTSSNVVLKIQSPYIDLSIPDSVPVQSTGALTKKTITINPNTNLIKIASSQIINFSPILKTYDLLAVGGGGAGGRAYSSSRMEAAGTGGGGGYTKEVKNLVATPNLSLNITIGAGGSNDRTGEGNPKDGGQTKVINENTKEIIAIANGGKHGETATDETQPSGGAGDGTGGKVTYRESGGNVYFNGTDGTRSSLGILGTPNSPAGGGGGGCMNRFYNGTQYTFGTPGKGAGLGGGGGLGINSSTVDGKDGQSGGGGGGGGSRFYNDKSGSKNRYDGFGGNGGDGAVWLKFYF